MRMIWIKLEETQCCRKLFNVQRRILGQNIDDNGNPKETDRQVKKTVVWAPKPEEGNPDTVAIEQVTLCKGRLADRPIKVTKSDPWKMRMKYSVKFDDPQTLAA